MWVPCPPGVFQELWQITFIPRDLGEFALSDLEVWSYKGVRPVSPP